jgi:hypothetical protein
MNTKTTGNLSEAKVLAALLGAGYAVLLPWGDNERYDMVIERAGSFERVQVKTGRIVRGAVRFKMYSVKPATRAAPQATRYYTEAEVDLFGVYCPALEAVYLVPRSDLAASDGVLRLDPARNGQVTGVRYAAQYLVAPTPPGPVLSLA